MITRFGASSEACTSIGIWPLFCMSMPANRDIIHNRSAGRPQEIFAKEKSLLQSEKIILVTGATGRQGGAVARSLLEKGWTVRAFCRNRGKSRARALQQHGAALIEGDLSNPASVANALEGAYGVFSMQQPWENGIEKEIEQGTMVADLAKEARVSHFVYSSVGGAHRETGIPQFESKWTIEEHIRRADIAFTILRPTYFMENFIQPDIRSGVYQGILSMPLRPGRSLQMIAVEDIGHFAAMAFDHPDSFVGRELEIAGDQLTGPEIADTFSSVMGKKVAFSEMPMQHMRSVNEDFAHMFEWLNTWGYEADIARLRKMHPGLKTLRQWLIDTRWEQDPGSTLEK